MAQSEKPNSSSMEWNDLMEQGKTAYENRDVVGMIAFLSAGLMGLFTHLKSKFTTSSLSKEIDELNARQTSDIETLKAAFASLSESVVSMTSHMISLSSGVETLSNGMEEIKANLQAVAVSINTLTEDDRREQFIRDMVFEVKAVASNKVELNGLDHEISSMVFDGCDKASELFEDVFRNFHSLNVNSVESKALHYLRAVKARHTSKVDPARVSDVKAKVAYPSVSKLKYTLFKVKRQFDDNPNMVDSNRLAFKNAAVKFVEDFIDHSLIILRQ